MLQPLLLPNGTNVPSVMNSVARVAALQWREMEMLPPPSSSLLITAATNWLLHSLNRIPLIIRDQKLYGQTPLLYSCEGETEDEEYKYVQAVKLLTLPKI